MKDKELEKLFEEKLKNYQVTPPAQSWDKLHTQLHEKQKSWIYWRVAASLFLVLAAGIAYVYLNKQAPDTARMADSAIERVQPSMPEPAMHPPVAAERKIAEQQSVERTAEAVAMRPKQLQQQAKPVQETPDDTEPALQQTSTESLLATLPKLESRKLAEISSVQNMPVVQDIPLHAQNASLKIIYKGDKPYENYKNQEKTFAFIDQLKGSNFSLSELRQAKDEWVHKTFSSKNEQTPETH